MRCQISALGHRGVLRLFWAGLAVAIAAVCGTAAHAAGSPTAGPYPLAASDSLWKQVFGTREDFTAEEAAHLTTPEARAQRLAEELKDAEALHLKAQSIPTIWLMRYGAVSVDLPH